MYLVGTVGEVNSERKHYGRRLLPLGKKGWVEIDLTKDRMGEKAPVR